VSRPRHVPHRHLTIAGAAIACLVLASCALGERPSFEQGPTLEGTPTGDAAIDAVLTQLDNIDQAVFTADYTATVVFNQVTTAVRATQTEPLRRAVTIGEVTFITDVTGSRTCTAGACEPLIDAASVSNTGVSPDFIWGDVAKRLRRAAASQVNAPVASTKLIASKEATCVAIPVTNGAVQACVFIDGVLAEFIGGDVTMRAESYTTVGDETPFLAVVSGP
jgi:hypothetical protein